MSLAALRTGCLACLPLLLQPAPTPEDAKPSLRHP